MEILRHVHDLSGSSFDEKTINRIAVESSCEYDLLEADGPHTFGYRDTHQTAQHRFPGSDELGGRNDFLKEW